MHHSPVSPEEPEKKDLAPRAELPDRSSIQSPHEKVPISLPRNRVSSPGLESLGNLPSEKEYHDHDDTAPEVHERPLQKMKKKKNKIWLFGALALLACIAIGLGVGLGVGLTRHQGGPDSASGSADVQAPTFSRTGAFNGSGIALASESFGSNSYGDIVMYFQHYTGHIRSTRLSNGDWQGGDATETVAVDAKNGTPIAAVAYARNNTASWHLFYVNINNTISEVTNSNLTNAWIAGPINDLHLQALDDPNIGLQACWYGSFYSDVSYNHSPVPGQNNTTSADSDQAIGIHLWYAQSPTSFGTVGWRYGDPAWVPQQPFDGYNGHAGVGCYSWGPGSDTYVFFVNLDSEINILWKDLNTTLKNSEDHPINDWVKSNISIPVYQNSSVGFTNYLYVQNTDLSIGGFNISWAAENSTIQHADDFVINGDKGLPGTHLSVTALPTTSGGNSLFVFYQTNGSDISEFVRDLDAGQWTFSQVPIPNV